MKGNVFDKIIKVVWDGFQANIFIVNLVIIQK